MAAALAAGRPSPATLRPGLAALEQGALAPAIRLLAGRGDGLTPAGDDVLAGYAAWTLAAGEPATLSALAAPRCSPIGLAYLRCAERGEVPEPATRADRRRPARRRPRRRSARRRPGELGLLVGRRAGLGHGRGVGPAAGVTYRRRARLGATRGGSSGCLG